MLSRSQHSGTAKIRPRDQRTFQDPETTRQRPRVIITTAVVGLDHGVVVGPIVVAILSAQCIDRPDQYPPSSVFKVRRSALHGLWDRNSVRPSVRLSVCPSVVDCVHMVRPTIMISTPYGSPIILVSGDIAFIPKFDGGHPERGR